MRWLASSAISRAVTFWPGSSLPQGLRKVRCGKPSSMARLFILSAKAASEPPSPSASTMAASLPESITSPRIRSSIRTRLLSAANMLDPREGAPPVRQAFSLTVNSWSRVSRPSLSSRNTSSAVMILAVEAGVMGASAAFSNRTEPVSASIRIAEGTIVWNGCAWAKAGQRAAAIRASTRTRERQKLDNGYPASAAGIPASCLARNMPIYDGQINAGRDFTRRATD